jgi:hypothetical protein
MAQQRDVTTRVRVTLWCAAIAIVAICGLLIASSVDNLAYERTQLDCVGRIAYITYAAGVAIVSLAGFRLGRSRVVACVAALAIGMSVYHGSVNALMIVGNWSHDSGVVSLRRGDLPSAESQFRAHQSRWDTGGLRLSSNLTLNRFGLVQNLRMRELTLLGDFELGRRRFMEATLLYEAALAAAESEGYPEAIALLRDPVP